MKYAKLLFFLCRFRKIEGEQHRKDKRLDQTEQKAQDIHDQRRCNWKNVIQILSNRFFTVKIAVKTQGQRERAHKLFDNCKEKQGQRH